MPTIIWCSGRPLDSTCNSVVVRVALTVFGNNDQGSAVTVGGVVDDAGALVEAVVVAPVVIDAATTVEADGAFFFDVGVRAPFAARFFAAAAAVAVAPSTADRPVAAKTPAERK